MPQIFKKTLIACLLPLQVMAASPSDFKTNQENEPGELPYQETYGIKNYKNIVENFDIKLENNTTNYGKFKNEMLTKNLTEYIKCYTGFCIEIIDLENIKSTKNLIKDLQKSYDVKVKQTTSYTLYTLKGSEYSFIKDKTNNNYYLTNYTENIKERLKSMKDLKELSTRNDQEVLNESKELFYLGTIANLNNRKKLDVSFGIKDNQLIGEINTFGLDKEITHKKEYNKKISTDIILSMDGYNQNNELGSLITSLEPKELIEMIQNLKSIEVLGENYYQISELNFYDLNEKQAKILQSLQTEEYNQFSDALKLEINGNKATILTGRSGLEGESIQETIRNYNEINKPETEVMLDLKNITGHFYLNTRKLLTNNIIEKTPDIILNISESNEETTEGEKFSSTFIQAGGEVLDLLILALNLEINNDITNPKVKIETNIEDVNKNEWYYENALRYAESDSEVFKSNTCKERYLKQIEAMKKKSGEIYNIEYSCKSSIKLKANNTISRAEFTKLILENVYTEDNNEVQKKFDDLNTNHKYYDEVQKAVQIGLLKGDDGKNTIRPDDGLNRAEAITMLQRAFPILNQKNYKEKISKFNDVPTDAWYLENLSEAVYEGVIKGTTETTFSPEVKLNRIEAIIMIQRLIDIEIKEIY